MTRLMKPQPGAQMDAAKSKARIVVAGAGAGTGKSWLAAWRAALYVHVPGYNAAVFRRTFPMLKGSGSILDEMRSFYPDLGGNFHQNDFEWRFPTPARVELKHLQHDKDAEAHKSKQYSFLNFEEASQFTGHQFFVLNSRLRSTIAVPKQFFLTTNPDPDCFIRPLIDWWLNSDGYPIPERSGVIRFFVRVKDEIVWNSEPEPLLKYVANDPHSVQSMTFIPGNITENVALMTADPGYLANLRALPATERERLLGGNWNIRESAAEYYTKGSFKQWGENDLQKALMAQDGRAGEVVQSIRVWDLASTPILGELVPGIERPSDFKARSASDSDPDYTCSVRLDRVRNGRIIISDATFCRDTPGAVQQLQERTAIEDGPRVTIGIFRDPGQAGDDQAERIARSLRKHSPCVVLDTADKQWNAREPARAAWRGEIYYLENRIPARFWSQLQGFPDPKVKDDAVVALSGAYRYLQEHPIPTYHSESIDCKVFPYDAILQDPARARELFHKKDQIRRGVIRVDVQSTRRWGRRNW